MNSQRNSITIIPGKDDPHVAHHAGSSSNLSIGSTHSASQMPNNFDSPAIKPRLVGLSQPFFATSPPLETPTDQLAAMERVAAEASRSGGKVRVLVAEDNKVNQEVVLRMLKLEDIYDVTVAKDGQEAYDLVKESMEQHKYFNLIFMDIQVSTDDCHLKPRLPANPGF